MFGEALPPEAHPWCHLEGNRPGFLDASPLTPGPFPPISGERGVLPARPRRGGVRAGPWAPILARGRAGGHAAYAQVRNAPSLLRSPEAPSTQEAPFGSPPRAPARPPFPPKSGERGWGLGGIHPDPSANWLQDAPKGE